MKIWVDADACPGVIKEILFRAAERTGLEMTLVANHAMRIPALHNINFIRVALYIPKNRLFFFTVGINDDNGGMKLFSFKAVE